ncbi:MAG: T9SS type A sorting domain-containing protein, partial [Ignavibacteriaceae bacterium]|nr:T9SS type A sorting domain-containing protein [Ignavibacteriaceae bacterium]
VLGKEVRVLINEEKKAGFYTIEFNATDLTSGVYYYKLSTDSFSATRKMTILK